MPLLPLVFCHRLLPVPSLRRCNLSPLQEGARAALKEEIAQEEIAKVSISVAAASNRPVLGEKAVVYAKALKVGGCDKAEDLMLFDRPFYLGLLVAIFLRERQSILFLSYSIHL